jgi:protein O-mannosyl-transferase
MAQRTPSTIPRSQSRASRLGIQPGLAAFASHPDLWFAIISACWVVLLYRHVIGAAFVYDDVPQIQNNPALSSWHSVAGYFRSAVPFNSDFRGFGGFFYRPLFWLSLAMDRMLWGLNATGFHITNLALHWANGFLAFMLLKKLRVSIFVSAAVSVVWLGLPINSEVVAWISGRSISLAVLFLLTGLLSADWYLCSNRIVALFGYAIASFASLLSHEIGVLTLPMACLMAYASNPGRRRWFDVSFVGSALVRLTGVGLTVDAVYLWLRHIAAAHLSSGVSAVIGLGISFWKYVAWMLLPLRMSVERSTDVPTNDSPMTTAAAFIGVLALFVAVLLSRRKMPEVAAGLTWLFIALVPFCGIVPIYQGMAERYTYLAALGLVLAMVALSFHLRNPTRSVALCAVILWMSWGAWRLNARVLDWRDETSIYTKSLEATPRSSILLYNLGVTFAEAGDTSKAADYYQRAIDLNPHYTSAMINLGNMFQRQGNYSQAEALYQRAIARDPRDPDAWVDLGNIYLQLAMNQAAKDAYEKAIALKPNDVEAIINLGAALQRSGDLSAATQAYQRAIAIDPSQASAYCDLGALLLQQGNIVAAREQLTKSIEHNPSYAPAYFNLGVLYEQTSRRDLAVEMYTKALDIQPDYPRARSRVERLQAASGTFPSESHP